MAKVIGITINPTTWETVGGKRTQHVGALYVALDDGRVYGRALGEGETWRAFEPVPGTPAAEAK